ncbi:MAG: dihydroorotase, partial [Chitinophagaceae bacterium]|nr:dihydroorotase [Chitinophagaceae bacterium]
MKLLIKQARVTDPSSPHNGKTLDLLIENGVITRISNSISENADHVIEKNGLHVSPGWADVFANFADPGYEYKETFDTGTQAAAAGGYTDVMV